MDPSDNINSHEQNTGKELPLKATYQKVLELGFTERNAAMDLCHPTIREYRYAPHMYTDENGVIVIEGQGEYTLVNIPPRRTTHDHLSEG